LFCLLLFSSCGGNNTEKTETENAIGKVVGIVDSVTNNILLAGNKIVRAQI